MNWKRLLLIALVAGGVTFVAAPRSDAQVYFSIGFGPGYYGGYYPYGSYYPYRYSITGRIATLTIDLTMGMGDTDIITATTVILTTVTGNEVT